MRKLICILSLFLVVYFSCINIVSCYSSKENNLNTKKTLNDFYAEIYDSDKAYYEIYTEISNFYNIKYNDLINDNNFELKLYAYNMISGETKLVKNDDILSYHLICFINIIINANDLYFKKTNIEGNCIVRKKINTSDFYLIEKENIYNFIYKQISNQISHSLNWFSIKNDPFITIKIYNFNSNLLLSENTLVQCETVYKVIINIDDGDQYYNKTNKEIDITSNSDKNDLNIVTFTLTTGDNLYADLENDALAQAPDGVSLADIQADQEMFIEAFEGSSTVKLLPKDTKVEAGKSYTIGFAVSSTDKFFNQVYPSIYKI